MVLDKVYKGQGHYLQSLFCHFCYTIQLLSSVACPIFFKHCTKLVMAYTF